MDRDIAENIGKRYRKRFGEEFEIEGVTPKKKKIYHFTYWIRVRGRLGKKILGFLGNIILWIILFIPRLIALIPRIFLRLKKS